MRKLSWSRLAVMAVVLAMLGGVFVGIGQAQSSGYPNKPITINVPWGAGGGTDRTTRAMAAALQDILGVQVNVVDFNGAGGGVVGHKATSDADPDGFTLGAVTVEITMFHWLGLTDLTFQDYDPLALMINNPAGITIRADEDRFSNYEELVQFVKDHPGELTATGTAAGGIWHLALIQWLLALGLDADAVRWVPSGGASEGLQFLISGTVDMCTCSPLEAVPLIEGGKAKAIAVMNNARLSVLPDVPTLQELGADVVVGGWAGLAGPRGLPNEVLAVLHKAIFDAANSQSFQDFLTSSGFNGDFRLGYRFQDLMAVQDAGNGAALKAAGLAK